MPLGSSTAPVPVNEAMPVMVGADNVTPAKVDKVLPSETELEPIVTAL